MFYCGNRKSTKQPWVVALVWVVRKDLYNGNSKRRFKWQDEDSWDLEESLTNYIKSTRSWLLKLRSDIQVPDDYELLHELTSHTIQSNPAVVSEDQ